MSIKLLFAIITFIKSNQLLTGNYQLMAVELPPSPIVMAKPKEQVGLIQGSQPQSIEEWYVAQALDFYHAEYAYQYSIGGGAGTRGGLVVDFVVFAATGRIPVFVQGLYWHNYRNDPERAMSLATAAHFFKTQPVELWEDKINTKEKARQAVRENNLV